MILCKIIYPYILLALCCSSLSITEEKDDLGRITRRLSHQNKKLESIENIQYIGSTTKPYIKKYQKYEGEKSVIWRAEVYSYKNARKKRISFSIYTKGKKILSGRIDYIYTDNKQKRIEYYSIPNITSRKMFKHGLDNYSYFKGNLKERRIIEYEYNSRTKRAMQISQYVIFYKNNRLQYMQTLMLDKKSKNIIKNEEKSLNIISEMIKNIENNFHERAKGVKYLK